MFKTKHPQSTEDFQTHIDSNSAFSTQQPNSTAVPGSSSAPSYQDVQGAPIRNTAAFSTLPLSAGSRGGASKAVSADEDGIACEMRPEGRGGHAQTEGSSLCFASLLEASRTLLGTACFWLAALCLIRLCAGNGIWELPPAAALFLATAAASIYALELRSRRVFWTLASCESSRESVAQKVQSLQDAEPLVDLQAPGLDPEPYDIAEWRDETRSIAKDASESEGALSGIVLLTFPLILLPGDESEAKALEHARERLAAGCITADEGSEAAPLRWDAAAAESVSVMMRLRMTNGLETGNPTPMVMAEGDAATLLRPLLWISICLGLGLIADNLLRCSLSPLEWPVRKRIFSLQGSAVGIVRLEVNRQGNVLLAGSEDTMRRANRYWLAGNDWNAMLSSIRTNAPEFARYRRWRRYLIWTTFGVALVAVALVLGTVLTKTVGPVSEVIALAGLFVTLALSLAACCMDLIAKRHVKVRMDDLMQELGTSDFTAEWTKEADPDTLVVTITQKADMLPGGGYREPTRSYIAGGTQVAGSSAFLTAAYIE